MTEFVELDCSECGEPVETPRPIHTECLDFHAETPHPEDLERAIPESDLQELVRQWRSGYDIYKRAQDPTTDIRANVLEQCADELEAVLEE